MTSIPHPSNSGTLNEADAKCAVECILAGCEAEHCCDETKTVQACLPRARTVASGPIVSAKSLVDALREQGVSWWSILSILPTILVMILPGTAPFADLLAKLLALLNPASKTDHADHGV